MEGGPTIGVSVEYAITDDGIATVHKSSGQLSAISPGNTVRFNIQLIFDNNLSTWPFCLLNLHAMVLKNFVYSSMV